MRETLYGRQAVRESLRANRRQPFRLWLMDRVVDTPIIEEIIALAQQRHVHTETISRNEMANLTGDVNHQGVALETSGYPYVEVDDILEYAQEHGETPLLLLFDLLQDIHNLGSLIRTAEAAGVHGIILQERRAAGVTAAVVNTSSGAVEHMLLARVTNLPRTIEQLKGVDIWIAGLDGTYGSKPYTEVDLTVPLGLVVGNEGDGLRRLVREKCDWLLTLPMNGEINSLNAAVAGSIALYEVLRQRAAQD